MQSMEEIFQWVPKDLTMLDVEHALAHYDGDGSKPYCDLVYCGLDIIRNYLLYLKQNKQ